MRIPIAISLLLLGTGCSLESLSQSWELDRLRVLGVRAIPAEPQPGQETVFESLVYIPEGTELETTIWFACLPENGSEFGCTIDTEALEGLDNSEELTPEESLKLFEQLQAAGVIGIEPFWSPSWTPPADSLDELTEEQQLEGLSAMINLTLLPAESDSEADSELAFKRVPVSLATHPNHNPEIIGIRVDGESLALGARLEAAPGAIYELEPILSEDSIETYTYVDSTGQSEERTEEPYFNWYSEYWYYPSSVDDYESEVPQPTPYTLYPHTSIEWTAPKESFDGIILVVGRDRRGGMAWAHLEVSVP